MIYLYLFYFFLCPTLTCARFCGAFYFAANWSIATICDIMVDIRYIILSRALLMEKKTPKWYAFASIFFLPLLYRLLHMQIIKIQRQAHMSYHLIITNLTSMQIFSGDRLLFVCWGFFFVRVSVFFFTLFQMTFRYIVIGQNKSTRARTHHKHVWFFGEYLICHRLDSRNWDW